MSKNELKIEYLPLKDIKPYEKNARKHEDDDVLTIIKSIEEFGFDDPIGIWSDKNIIVEGHGRYIAAKRLGMKNVPCIRLDHLTDEQRRAYALAHNKTAEMSEWDAELLPVELENIFEIDMTDFGFELPTDDEPDEEPEIIEDEIPTDINSFVKSGDLWVMGKHRLVCGDCTHKENVDLLMSGKTAELAFTSPPYNIGTTHNLNDGEEGNKYIGYDDENTDYIELINNSTQIAIDNSKYAAINIQMLAGNKIEFTEWLYNFRKYLCDLAIWYKDNVAPAMARRVMNSAFEFVAIFSKENQTRCVGTNDFRGTVSNVYQSHIQTGNEFSKVHSATFPVEFAAHFIKSLTNEKETVLDLFGGTGTTLIACEQINRSCYMCELSEEYSSIIIDRYIKLTNDADSVYCIRNGKKYSYEDVVLPI